MFNFAGAKGCPESYMSFISSLMTMHPYWAFQCEMSSMLWEDFVLAEYNSAKGCTSLTAVGNINEYDANPRCGTCDEGSQWCKASKQAIQYYADPRNFLNEKHVFLFTAIDFYDPAVHAVAAVEKVVEGCTWMTDYVPLILRAAQKANVSPMSLASKIRMEMGCPPSEWGPNGMDCCPSCCSGVCYTPTPTDSRQDGEKCAEARAENKGQWSCSLSNYADLGDMCSLCGANKKCHNFFNMGVWSKSTCQCEYAHRAVHEAKLRGWHDEETAVLNGAAAFKQKYFVERGQVTQFYTRWNIRDGYSGQYMTNVAGPFSETSKWTACFEAAGKLDVAHVFKVPYWEGMPDYPVKV